ncbi:MAG: hypothetical protein MZV70_43020 [Desulfobacterales bacterium]|nr:hypothetical protein [Desulfobacterales bacterium]
MHVVAGEARTIEGRLSASDWLVGEQRVRGRHGRVPGHHAAAARDGEARGRRPALALPADGGDLSRDRPLDPPRRERCPATTARYPPHWRDGAPRG